MFTSIFTNTFQLCVFNVETWDNRSFGSASNRFGRVAGKARDPVGWCRKKRSGSDDPYLPAAQELGRCRLDVDVNTGLLEQWDMFVRLVAFAIPLLGSTERWLRNQSRRSLMAIVFALGVGWSLWRSVTGVAVGHVHNLMKVKRDGLFQPKNKTRMRELVCLLLPLFPSACEALWRYGISQKKCGDFQSHDTFWLLVNGRSSRRCSVWADRSVPECEVLDMKPSSVRAVSRCHPLSSVTFF